MRVVYMYNQSRSIFFDGFETMVEHDNILKSENKVTHFVARMRIVHTLLVVVGIAVILVASLVTHQASASPEEARETQPKESASAAFVIHTFDGYRRYWQGMLYFFVRHHSKPEWPVYFVNEVRDASHLWHGPPEKFHQIHTGKGPWGQRLLKALQQIPEKHVLYLQEDMWLIGKLEQNYLDQALDLAVKQQAHQVKLQAGCQHRQWKTKGEGHPSWYVVSHQPGLWSREFLISTLNDQMSPYDHEIHTNLKLQHDQTLTRSLCGGEHGLSAFPYQGVSVTGVLSRNGRIMLQKARLPYRIEHDEVGYRSRPQTV